MQQVCAGLRQGAVRPRCPRTGGIRLTNNTVSSKRPHPSKNFGCRLVTRLICDQRSSHWSPRDSSRMTGKRRWRKVTPNEARESGAAARHRAVHGSSEGRRPPGRFSDGATPCEQSGRPGPGRLEERPPSDQGHIAVVVPSPENGPSLSPSGDWGLMKMPLIAQAGRDVFADKTLNYGFRSVESIKDLSRSSPSRRLEPRTRAPHGLGVPATFGRSH